MPSLLTGSSGASWTKKLKDLKKIHVLSSDDHVVKSPLLKI